MALTGSDKQKYNELIQMLWKGSVPSSVAQITSEVADIVDKVIVMKFMTARTLLQELLPL